MMKTPKSEIIPTNIILLWKVRSAKLLAIRTLMFGMITNIIHVVFLDINHSNHPCSATGR